MADWADEMAEEITEIVRRYSGDGDDANTREIIANKLRALRNRSLTSGLREADDIWCKALAKAKISA